MDPSLLGTLQEQYDQLKFSILVIGALPMMLLYPFIQKYFIRGLMIGSLKE
jgi:ABC-type glycerol-3-phosphate transport system permease component